jgi:iron complex outermembrane receptor protein
VALLAAASSGAVAMAAPPAHAQDQGAAISEIIVTARKRQESLLNVPVVENVLPQQRLERLQTLNLADVSTQVPGLVLATGTATSGLQVSIRGIGTNSQDPSVDQSVSLFIDGLQFSQGLAYEAGMFDVAQVEVLKGPQSLFYGKSSPGGVISLRTADPTNAPEVIMRAAYEPEARQKRGELILSGPITDTLKARLSGMYENEDGYYYNKAIAAPGLGGKTPKYDRLYPTKSYAVRGTVLWSPTSNFDARFKLDHFHTRQVQAGDGQITSCPDGTAGPFGIPFIAGDDCKLNRTARIVDIDPAAFPDVWFNGVPQLRLSLLFGTAELNYHPTPHLTVTSVTGFFRQRSRLLLNATNTTAAGPPILVQNRFDRDDFTQELRLNSDYAGPLNFTLGGYYQDAHFMHGLNLPGNLALGLPRDLSAGAINVFIYTYSVFGQARWALTHQLELAAGARWTDEIRRAKIFNTITGTPMLIPLGVPRIQSKTWSPEVTLTYKPTDTVTAFGSWKKGYKSGNFNAGQVPAPGSDPSYGDEQVKGWELGVKSRLLDRRLALEAAFYDYNYKNLQVGVSQTNSVGVPVAATVNAGAAKVYGVDFAASYRPEAVEGLTLNLDGEWNHGEFKTLNNVPCWFGQLISEGCNQQFSPVTGQFNAQDLSNSPLPRGPRWQVNFGFDYERPVARDMTLVITNNNNYTSRFQSAAGLRPDFYQSAYVKADLSLALRGRNDRWEVALIGKNITSKITASGCATSNLANGAIFGPDQFTGTNTRGPAGVAEVVCRLDQGREIWMRLTYKPFS